MKLTKRVSLFLVMGAVAITALFGTALREAKAMNFKDVSATHWAKDSILAAVNAGYFKGYSNGTFNNGTFKPDATITRAEFASLLSRISKAEPPTEIENVFNDLNNHWSKKQVERAVAFGFIDPKNYPNGFKPNTALTREEMAIWLSSGLAALDEAYKQALLDTKETLIPVKEYFKPGIPESKAGHIAVAMGTKLMSGYPDGSFGMKNTTTRAETSAILLRFVKAAAKKADTFPALNELRAVGTEKNNLEVVTPFKPTRSMTEASGKTKTFRNNAGQLVFHRMIAVNVENWNEKSFYGDLFVSEINKGFLTEEKGTYPVFMEITIYPKSKDFDVDHYYSGMPNLMAGAAINNENYKKYGYKTMPRTETKEFFAARSSGVKLWVVRYFVKGQGALGEVEFDDGSFLKLVQAK
ncbi:S-layer homology domain-containing protein [Paenibacillus thiaminolyticus]|uniref:S-layer homology domain-containing protein n=1 Tax=Paenibacillus thiaminolyticus TaxID=49283 RepID=A0AAP9DWM7_PANTH|nr:S-layer homology domain-containing protein [Paenibacillus thiaminolyticus]MCY9538399.1 S-layer homology domain-containing protein [Paenibacillus thiaminolyticus]MCY9602694.1 S-layer homology domain-containing protein [Paenibacillus thiaminolyticus]MCY9610814.1 S-layer homology domain-containing protein [Paenibacillus thiaminolyticus]MCY9631841.1 S-layer homology domain-containing protein [Paenibacillus thiaminolyticus]MCY9649835.1 S-layer homology domain-containing protein [Paenibacillus th